MSDLFLRESERNELLAELRDAAAGIKEELEELGFIREELEGINGKLETLAIAGRPVLPESVSRLELDARKTLYIVRAILDSKGELVPASRERLFEAEEILSRALGNPIWEGRNA